MNYKGLLFVMLLNTLAGLSTGLGGLTVFFFKRTNTKIISVALGLSAGVMIYVAFVELLISSDQLLIDLLGVYLGSIINIISFLSGIILIAVVDQLIPDYEFPFKPSTSIEINGNCDSRLLKTGFLTAIIISIHNFPEGIITLISSIQQPALGITMAIAIAIHNIPEGISVSVPVFYSTGSRIKAIKWSLISGLTEPFGAFIAYMVLLPFINNMILGILLGIISGIMVFISLCELLPAAQKYNEHGLSSISYAAGMIIMASILLLYF